MSVRAIAVALAWLWLTTAGACDGLVVDEAWIRQPPPTTTTAAGYFVARNRGATALTIARVESDQFGMVMLHETRVVEGRAQMRMLGPVAIAPGGEFRAAPGGAHVMLGAPRVALTADTPLSLRLVCADGTALDVPLVLRRAPPAAP